MSLGGSRGSVMLVRGLCASRHRAAVGLLGGLPLGVSRGRVVGRSSSAQRGAGGLSGGVFSVGSEGVTRRPSRAHGSLPRRRSNRCCLCRPVDYLPGWLWSRFDPGGDLRPGGACGDHSASGGQFPPDHIPRPTSGFSVGIKKTAGKPTSNECISFRKSRNMCRQASRLKRTTG